MNKKIKLILCLMVCVGSFSMTLYADPITKPFNFETGTKVSSSQVNQNFDVVYEKVNQLDSTPALPAPDYDTGWFPLETAQSYSFSIGFSGLPRIVTAYYKLSNGQILLYGMNQYGDGWRDMGVLLDFDENGTLYVRSAEDEAGNFGNFRNRDNSGFEGLYNQTNMQFRILLTK